jgi:ATP adenylyltransferase
LTRVEGETRGGSQIVTKQFEQQTDPLNESDFACVWKVLRAFPSPGGLAFYNCGDASGHSQPHKHVQVVPLPLSAAAAASSPAPLDALIFRAAAAAGCNGVEAVGSPFRVGSLPFQHVCCMLHRTDARVTASALAQWCGGMRATVTQTSESWNLVMTMDWMMMVPRSKDRTGSVALKCAPDLRSCLCGTGRGSATAGFGWAKEA